MSWLHLMTSSRDGFIGRLPLPSRRPGVVVPEATVEVVSYLPLTPFSPTLVSLCYRKFLASKNLVQSLLYLFFFFPFFVFHSSLLLNVEISCVAPFLTVRLFSPHDRAGKENSSSLGLPGHTLGKGHLLHPTRKNKKKNDKTRATRKTVVELWFKN